jgi:hypothetical protein
MLPIPANGLPALPARFPGFFGSKFVGRSFFMGCFATFTGNLPLLLFIHRGKATIAASFFTALRVGHRQSPFLLDILAFTAVGFLSL